MCFEELYTSSLYFQWRFHCLQSPPLHFRSLYNLRFLFSFWQLLVSLVYRCGIA